MANILFKFQYDNTLSKAKNVFQMTEEHLNSNMIIL